MKNYFNLTEQLIITFTMVLLLLGCTIIYLFIFIQNQKKQKYILTKKLDEVKINKLN